MEIRVFETFVVTLRFTQNDKRGFLDIFLVQDGRNDASVNNRQNPDQILLLPLDIRSWDCPSCETKNIDRDVNAAKKCDSFSLNRAIGGQLASVG